MTNSISGINGGGNSYNINWGSRRNDENKGAENTENTSNGIEQTPVDPNKIMEFMAKNNYFVNPTEGVDVNTEVDAATKDRVAGYMEQFEMIYSLIVEDFGVDKADVVMNTVMDKLLGMAA